MYATEQPSGASQGELLMSYCYYISWKPKALELHKEGLRVGPQANCHKELYGALYGVCGWFLQSLELGLEPVSHCASKMNHFKKLLRPPSQAP